jgi:hypothetical protein
MQEAMMLVSDRFSQSPESAAMTAPSRSLLSALFYVVVTKWVQMSSKVKKDSEI